MKLKLLKSEWKRLRSCLFSFIYVFNSKLPHSLRLKVIGTLTLLLSQQICTWFSAGIWNQRNAIVFKQKEMQRLTCIWQTRWTCTGDTIMTVFLFPFQFSPFLNLPFFPHIFSGICYVFHGFFFSHLNSTEFKEEYPEKLKLYELFISEENEATAVKPDKILEIWVTVDGKNFSFVYTTGEWMMLPLPVVSRATDSSIWVLDNIECWLTDALYSATEYVCTKDRELGMTRKKYQVKLNKESNGE